MLLNILVIVNDIFVWIQNYNCFRFVCHLSWLSLFYNVAPTNAIYKPTDLFQIPDYNPLGLWAPLLGKSLLPCPTPLCPTSVFNPTCLVLDIQEEWFPFFPRYLCWLDCYFIFSRSQQACFRPNAVTLCLFVILDG